TANYSPDVTTIAVVGDISEKDAVDAFKSLELRWERKEVEFKDYPIPTMPETPALYFVDFPDAKQSVIRIGNLSLAYTDDNYYPAQVMNYKLGGNFNSYVNMILREEKGYTYGARTSFSGTLYPGSFSASSSVRSNATFESAQIFINQMNKYREGISKEDLIFTKNALIKSNARRFETLGALRGMLNNIATYNLPFDYIKKYEEIVRNMTLEDHKELANKYIDPNVMTYVIVGDAKTQLEQLKDLGVGKPILVDREGNPVN
ncbi:MAG: insulinase family protein, partial [Ignavibacteria bacterium]|nr:insulinase family protein [Ignavibacteria bacterium]